MAVDEREVARKRAEQRQQSSWFKLKEGDNIFRILPTPPSKTHTLNWFEYALHNEVGPKKVRVRCGINPVTGKGSCWLCDVKIPKLKDKKMETRAAALEPKAQLLVQVAKVDEDGKMTGPFLFTPAKTVADQLLARIFGSRKRSYLDPKTGYNITINRTGTGRNDTKYGIIEPDEDPSIVPSALVAKVKPFEELKEIQLYSAAKQQAAYTGKTIEEDDEPEETPVKKHKKPVEEEEDVDVEEEEPETEDEDSEEDAEEDSEDADSDADEDEEEAPPKKKKKPAPAPVGKKKKVVDEDEEESEEEESEDEDTDTEDEDSEDADEDAEEEAPAKKKKPAAKPAGKKKVVEEEEDIPDDDLDLDDVAEEEEDETESEDEDSEDEEEAPPKKKKPIAKPAAKSGLKPKPKSKK